MGLSESLEIAGLFCLSPLIHDGRVYLLDFMNSIEALSPHTVTPCQNHDPLEKLSNCRLSTPNAYI